MVNMETKKQSDSLANAPADSTKNESKLENPKLWQNKKVGKIFLKAFLWTLGIICLIWFLASLFIGLIAYQKINQFTSTANVSKKELKQTLVEGWFYQPTVSQNHKNILILGLDKLDGRGSTPPLTDTMLLLSLNFETGKIKTLPLPRDLWSQPYQTKINALYAYGLEKNPDQPAKFPQQVIEEMTGLTLHHTLTISMQDLATVINLLDGIEVEIEQSFTDERFPKMDVDVTSETDPTILYETVSFSAGSEVMNGSRALQYMRSRHGDNDQNTDLARSQRQQAVIEALTNKLFQLETWLEVEKMAHLYRFYLDNFAPQLPLTEIVATAKRLWPVRQNIQLISETLSVYPDHPEGLIEHPPQYRYDEQWVYIIRDQEEFKAQVQSKILEN